MTDETVKSIASEMQVSPEDLLKNFSYIGMKKSLEDIVTKEEKETLMSYLQKRNKIIKRKLVFQKKIRSTLNVVGTGGQNKKISIEIRKIHSYIRYNSRNNINFENTNLSAKQEKDNKITGQNEFISDNSVNNLSLIKNKNVQTNLFYKRDIENTHSKFESEKKILKPQLDSDFQDKNFLEYEKNNIKSHEYSLLFSKKHLNSEKKKYEVKMLYDINNNNEAHDVKNVYDKKNENDYRKNKKISLEKEEDTSFFQKTSYENKENEISFMERNEKDEKAVITLKSSKLQELKKKIDPIFWNKIEKNFSPEFFEKNILNAEMILKIEKLIHKKIIVSAKKSIKKDFFIDQKIQKNEILESKPPVVTIIGHVNHGKTSLLQCIRSMKISQKEHGGITQRIGAYHITTKNGIITFLDTPGHSAFSSMRNRGMQITDIAVLVVAADDGVMPQTVESIQNAKKFNVPIIVAINKVDKLNIDTEKIKNELANYGIISEEWGGDNQFVYVSAKSRKGIDSLLEAILLQAEMLELRYSKNKPMIGTVIESYIDKGWGPVVTVLLRDGNLKKGDVLLCGVEYGKVRAMRNENGESISSIGPSIPVEIFGLSGIPNAGEKIISVLNEKKAREMSLCKRNIIKEKKSQDKRKKINVESLFKNMDIKRKSSEFNLILKSDVQGLIEPIIDTIKKEIKENILKINIIGSGVGNITETDAMLALASKATLIGFNVRIDFSAKKIIKKENLNHFICYTIYQLTDNIKSMINETFFLQEKRKRIGLAEVKDVFLSKKFGAIAGCMVIEGLVSKNKSISVFRDKKLVYEGKLESLRRFKDNVNEVKMGMECGIVIKNYGDYKIGDIIQIFEE